MRKFISVAVMGLVLAGITVSADQSYVPPPSGLKFSEPWRPAGSQGDTRVIGSVIDIRLIPVTRVKVQLRNLDTGTVTESAMTDDNGEYEFDIEVPSSYVVEMVLVDGYIISLSNAGSVARYETLQTVIQLPGRWDALRQALLPNQTTFGFVGVSSEISMTAATMSLAVTHDISPMDAGEPVSPES